MISQAASTHGATANPTIQRTVASLAPSLINLLREARGLASHATMSVELDEDDINRQLPRLSVTIAGINFSAARLLTMAVNGYRKMQIPDAPELSEAAVKPVKDEDSYIVQAADVLGNFAMNFLFRKLGITSGGKARKGQIFDAVFGHRVESIEFLKGISLTGNQNHDLRLAHEGQAAFRIGWVLEK